jgi:hypothetical protein
VQRSVWILFYWLDYCQSRPLPCHRTVFIVTLDGVHTGSRRPTLHINSHRRRAVRLVQQTRSGPSTPTVCARCSCLLQISCDRGLRDNDERREHLQLGASRSCRPSKDAAPTSRFCICRMTVRSRMSGAALNPRPVKLTRPATSNVDVNGSSGACAAHTLAQGGAQFVHMCGGSQLAKAICADLSAPKNGDSGY